MDLKTKLKSTPFRFLKSSSDRSSVRFEKDHLKEVTAKQSSGFSLEVIYKGKLGYASSNQPGIDYLIDSAIASSEFGDRATYDYPKPKELTKVRLFSDQVVKLQTKDFIAIGESIIESIKQEDPNILLDVRVERSIGKSLLQTSSGFLNEHPETNLSIYCEGELVNKGDILMIDNYFAWRENTFDLDKFVRDLKTKFTLAKKIVPAASGKKTIIFTPGVLNTLLDFIETALSAQAVYKKVSKWTNSMGKQVSAKEFNLSDDPTIDFAQGSTNFDDEGFAVKPLILIKNGKLLNFYTDLKNAKKLKIAPNGRGFGMPAGPGSTNVVVAPGNKLSEQMIRGIKDGVIIHQVIGGGMDSPYTGDFSLNIHLGFLISNGEIVGRVKDTLITGNIFEMLKDNLLEISSDREWYGGAMNLPFISFDKINIVSK